MKNFDCSVHDRRGCNYCMRMKTINTSGDSFTITVDEKENRSFLSTNGAHFFTMDIRYCPICGRKLEEDDDECNCENCICYMCANRCNCHYVTDNICIDCVFIDECEDFEE